MSRYLVLSVLAATVLTSQPQASAGRLGHVVRRVTTARPAKVRAVKARSRSVRHEPPGKAVTRAKDLARETLSRNILLVRTPKLREKRRVIVASSEKFKDAWARDAMFASMGLLATGSATHRQAVGDTLEVLMAHQFPDGLIPRRVGHGSTAAVNVKYVLRRHNRANPDSMMTVDRKGGLGGLAVDPNLLVPIVAEEFVAASGDRAFAERHYTGLVRALEWLPRDRDGLVYQEETADWKDLAKRGHTVMYSQALHYQALKSMSSLAAYLGKRELAPRRRLELQRDAVRFSMQAARVKRAIQRRLWDPSRDHFADSETSRDFSPDGNLMAVAFGIATPSQAEAILERSARLLHGGEALLPALEGRYRWRQIPLAASSAGMARYHDKRQWPWLTSLYALASARAGKIDHARLALNSVARAVDRSGAFFEVHRGRPSRPAHSILHRSEKGFSWSAGLFLRAEAELSRLERATKLPGGVAASTEPPRGSARPRPR
jgi:glycogen debranching enzyme